MNKLDEINRIVNQPCEHVSSVTESEVQLLEVPGIEPGSLSVIGWVFVDKSTPLAKGKVQNCLTYILDKFKIKCGLQYEYIDINFATEVVGAPAVKHIQFSVNTDYLPQACEYFSKHLDRGVEGQYTMICFDDLTSGKSSGSDL